MTHQEIFSKFCKYVHEHIFSDESIGSYVSFVVDKTFIQDFCRQVSCSEQMLMTAVRSQLWYARRDISTVKGILAIQLYAASKRANSDGVTVKNYRDRLSQVLDWDINDLQSWMSSYQESYWEILYKWCDSHYFQITKCQRKSGAGRYVQYPVNQALRVFTEEDLKYIASYFVEKSLLPGEDIQERDFWRLLSKYRISSYIQTNHGRNVIYNSVNDEDYYSQIYNYYLRWNGEYKRRYTDCVYENKEKDSYLYVDEDFSLLEFRTSHLRLLHRLDVKKTKYEDVNRYFTFKHEGMILFKKDDIYDNYLQETRYIERGEEGFALCFKGKCRHNICRSTHHLIHEKNGIRIYKITYSTETHDLFTTKRFYMLYGGLKVGRQSYLYGAAPILKLEHTSKLWIDGETPQGYDGGLSVNLNYLKEGFHYIKIPNFKKLEIEICKLESSVSTWLRGNNRWNIDKKEVAWDSGKSDEGIVGLDFSLFPLISSTGLNGSVLTRWSKCLTFGEVNKKENNIAINIIKNNG